MTPAIIVLIGTEKGDYSDKSSKVSAYLVVSFNYCVLNVTFSRF